ncbi:MAG: A24 family peptidase C-terminal domain-containing protein [Nanoarchaeota archaeon]
MIFWFLIGVVILGGITTYTDIKYGKIKNKVIVFALSYALIFQFIYFSVFSVEYSYIIQSIFNVVSALIIGYLMWDVGLWTAGDGKLFLAYATLIPLFIYNKASNIPFFSSMNILINTFVPLFFFFLINLLIKTSLIQKKASFKKAFNPKRVFVLILTLFCFFWIIDIITGILGVGLNFFYYILLLFLIVYPIERVMKQKFLIVVILICLARIVFDRSIFTMHFILTFFSFFLVFLVLRYFVIELGFSRFTTSVPINKLKQGMVPAEMIYKNNERKKILFFSFFEYLREKNNKSLFDIRSEGLTKKDIDKIKKLAQKHPDFKTFQIQQTLPFAPFLFCGAILTIIAQGNVFIFLKNIFS